MKITKEYLKSVYACREAYVAFKKFGSTDLKEIVDEAMRLNRFDWANWLLSRCLKTKKKRVMYVIYSAKLVIDIYESKYNDDRPRKAIEAAKAYVKNPSKKTKAAARDAYDAYDAYDAAAAAAAARAAYVVAAGAAYDAYAAAAAAAARAAYVVAAYAATYDAAYDAAYAAAYAADAYAADADACAAAAARQKIVAYGLKLAIQGKI